MYTYTLICIVYLYLYVWLIGVSFIIMEIVFKSIKWEQNFYMWRMNTCNTQYSLFMRRCWSEVVNYFCMLISLTGAASSDSMLIHLEDGCLKDFHKKGSVFALIIYHYFVILLQLMSYLFVLFTVVKHWDNLTDFSLLYMRKTGKGGNEGFLILYISLLENIS